MEKAKKIVDLYDSYCELIVKNPAESTYAEYIMKWMSYGFSGRYENATVSELFYSITNLISLFNDYSFRRGNQKSLTLNKYEKIKTYLTVIEYLEVTLEMWSKNKWGPKGKWTTIALIQLTKCACQFYLLLKRNKGFVSHPAIQPMDRVLGEAHRPIFRNSKFILKTGLAVNKTEEFNIGYGGNDEEPEFETDQLIAECLYLSKPLVHLALLYNYGMKSWKPYFIAMSLDMASIVLHKRHHRKLTRAQDVQLFLRQLNLLLYLLRSPFYDCYSKRMFFSLNLWIQHYFSLIHSIIIPFANYAPVWCETYLYMWPH